MGIVFKRVGCVAALVMLLAGCGSGSGSGASTQVLPPPPAPAPPAPSPSPQLKSGELFISESGVAVGAPVGSLAAPVTLILESVGMPAIPLPAGLEAVGEAWRIGAAESTDPSPGTQFTIGLARPAGENPDLLQIALLLPADSTLDGPGTDMWTVLRTQHDPARDLLYTGAAVLLPEGSLYALVRLATAVAAGGSASTKAVSPDSVQSHKLVWTSSPNPLVEARCSSEFIPPVTNCTPDDLRLLEEDFENFYTELISIGYPFPALQRRVTHNSALAPPYDVEYGPFQVLVRPCEVTRAMSSLETGSSFWGVYDTIHETLESCIASFDVSSSDDERRATLRHELFHAFQFAFGVVFNTDRNTHKDIRSFIEGQATAATFSNSASLSRESTWEWYDHFLNPLGDGGRDDYAYRAQDFWVYLGQRLGRGLDLFLPFLRRGPLPEQVDTAFRLDIRDPGIPDLGSAFFAWGRNQMMEADVLLPGSGYGPYSTLLGGRCSPQHYDKGNPWPEFPGFIGDDHRPISYDPDHPGTLIGSGGTYVDGRHTLSFPDGRLLESVAHFYRLSAPRDYSARVYLEPGNEMVRYKVYEVGSASSDACLSEPSDQPRYFDIKQGVPRDVVVLWSWTGHEPPPETSASTLVIERVSVYLDRQEASHALTEVQTETGFFTISNGSSAPVSFGAVPDVPWLSVIEGASGVIPANGSIQVVYQVSCAAAGSSAQGALNLAFAVGAGAPLSGPDIPGEFRISQTCSSEPQACVDYSRYRGNVVSATLSWNANGANSGTVSGQAVTLSDSVVKSVSITTTERFARNVDGEYIPGSTQSVAQGDVDHSSMTTTVTESSTSTTMTEWLGSGEAFSGTSVSAGPAAALASLSDPDACLWALSIGPAHVDVAITQTSASGAVSTSTGRYGINGNAVVRNVGLSGSAMIPVACTTADWSAPECGGYALNVVPNFYLQRLGLTRDDTALPPVSISWSIAPIVED